MYTETSVSKEQTDWRKTNQKKAIKKSFPLCANLINFEIGNKVTDTLEVCQVDCFAEMSVT